MARNGSESIQVLINHWRWLEANGYKQQAASCKRQAASLTRKNYNVIGLVKEKEEMKTEEALKIIGGSLSKPSKMPGWSIGLPAKECKTGGKLQKVPGSVCYDCYALKVVMCSRLCRMHNTEGWQLLRAQTGSRQWPT